MAKESRYDSKEVLQTTLAVLLRGEPGENTASPGGHIAMDLSAPAE
jgi:hypothetical protein